MKKDKYIIKAQKKKQRDIKKTLKKARVPKNATRKLTYACIFNYVAQHNPGGLRFSDELLSDPDFLLGLYNANIEMVNLEEPNPRNKELQNNVNFMIEYLKQKYLSIKIEYHDDKTWQIARLEWAIEKYSSALMNPNFVARVVEEFPDVRILPIIKRCFTRPINISYLEPIKTNISARAEYKNYLSKLPLETLCFEAKKFGVKALNEIPKDIPKFDKIVSAAIEKDGFDALEKLPAKQILENKELIFKAYHQNNRQGLNYFITHSLSPLRQKCFYKNGKPYHYTIFDKEYYNVQKTLKEDPKIQYLMQKESCLLEARKQRTQIIIDNSTSVLNENSETAMSR